MPEPAQPLASVLAFSAIVTDRFDSLALMAAMQPARPPPMTRTSVSTSTISVLCGMVPPGVVSLLLLAAQYGDSHGQRRDHADGAGLVVRAAFPADAVVGAFVGILHGRRL